MLGLLGALDWGVPQCHMSILRKGNVACLCHLYSTMSHVKFKKWLCPMSLYFYLPVTCHLALGRMSNLRNGHVAVSILGVKGHLLLYLTLVRVGQAFPSYPGYTSTLFYTLDIQGLSFIALRFTLLMALLMTPKIDRATGLFLKFDM